MITNKSEELEQIIKQYTQELRESEEKWHSLVQNIPDFIFTLDREGTVLFINRSILPDFPVDQIIGKKIYELVSPEHAKKIKKLHNQCFKTGKEFDFEELGPGPVGLDTNWYRTRIIPVKDDKNITAIMQISSDITAHKKVEQEVEQKSREMETFINNIPHMAWLKDLDSNFILANKAFGEAVGMDPEYLKNNTCAVCFGEDAAEKFKEDDKVVMKKKKQITLEESIVDKDGNTVYLETTKSPIMNDIGEIVGTVGIGIDITERKKAEQKIKESEEELKKLNIELEYKVEERTSELRKSEKKFKDIIENINDSIIISGLDGKLKYISPQYSKLIGKPLNVGDAFGKTMHPDDFKRVTELFAQALKKGKALEMGEVEYRVKHKDGHYIWISTTTSNHYDEDGNLIGFLTTARDVSDRKITEQRLRESEKKYRIITDNSKEAVFMMDLNLKQTFASPASFDMLGYTPEELIGMSAKQTTTPESLAYIAEVMKEEFKIEKQEVKDLTRSRKLEIQQIRKDGQIIDVGMSVTFIRNNEDKAIGIIGLSRDISARKRAERKLKESEKKYRYLLDNIADLILEIDLEYMITYISPQVRDILGYSVDEIINTQSYLYVHPDDLNLTAEAIETTIQTGKVEVEFRMLHKDGYYVPVAAKGKLVDMDGKAKLISVIRDITERKKSEKALLDNERYLDEIFEFLPVGIGVTDLEGNILDLNQKFVEMFGYTLIDIPTVFDWYPKAYPDINYRNKSVAIWDSDIKKAIETGLETPARVYHVTCSDGVVRDIEITMKPGIDKNIVSFVDITERKEAEQKLRMSEERLRLISENANDVVWTTDMSLNMTYVSPSTQNLSGWTVDEIMKMSIDQYHTPSSYKILVEGFSDELNLERKKEKDLNRIRIFEVDQIHKNGSILNVEMVVTFIRDENQKAIGLVGVTRNITERKKSEQKLEDIARFPSENPNPVLRANINEILYANQSGKVLFNIREGSKVPLILSEYISESISSIKTQEIELQLANRVFSFTIAPIKETGYVNIYGKDITERKETEEKLKNSEEKYRLMTEGIKDAIWVMDTNFKFKYISPAIKELRGFTVEEAMNQTMKEMFPPESLKILTDLIRKEFVPKNIRNKKYNPTWQIELEQYCKDGSTVYVEINMNLIRDAEGKPYEIMGISRDITDRKKSEQKIIESEKNYRKAYKQANFYKDLFVHDISNIFNALYGYSQLYSEYQEEMAGLYEQDEMMKNMNRHVFRGVNLIKDVQKLSTLDNSNIPKRKVNMNKILHEAIENTINSFPKKEIQVEFDSSSKKINIQANELLLDVFENILNNAAKYNKNSLVEILIRINEVQENNEKHVKIEFLDNGIGIMDELKQYTFKKGYKTEMKSKGMGFGLSIVKKILKSYGGKIWVENKVEGDYSQGSNFVLLIPMRS